VNPLRRLVRSPRLVRAAYASARRLPVGSDAALRLGRTAWRRMAGASPSAADDPDIPRRFVPADPPRTVGRRWPRPPEVDEPGRAVAAVSSTVGPAPAFDIELMEQLHAECLDHPLVPVAPGRTAPERAERARARLLDVHREIDVADRRVLEIGCGAGYEVWYLSHHFGADAWGLDIVERGAWQALADERTHYVLGDLTAANLFEADTFDRIISFAVWEHIAHPSAALAETFRVLRPGGLAWIKANLHRGPMASHLYADIAFPYPHLLFSDAVIREFMRRHERPVTGASWVNRLSWADYEARIRAIGFRIRALRFTGQPIDEAFYRRFESVLGRYPRSDLAHDFFEVVLEKPA
jgi:SAM-dependent methyltransferase